MSVGIGRAERTEQACAKKPRENPPWVGGAGLPGTLRCREVELKSDWKLIASSHRAMFNARVARGALILVVCLAHFGRSPAQASQIPAGNPAGSPTPIVPNGQQPFALGLINTSSVPVPQPPQNVVIAGVENGTHVTAPGGASPVTTGTLFQQMQAQQQRVQAAEGQQPAALGQQGIFQLQGQPVGAGQQGTLHLPPGVRVTEENAVEVVNQLLPQVLRALPGLQFLPGMQVQVSIDDHFRNNDTSAPVEEQATALPPPTRPPARPFRPLARPRMTCLTLCW